VLAEVLGELVFVLFFAIVFALPIYFMVALDLHMDKVRAARAATGGPPIRASNGSAQGPLVGGAHTVQVLIYLGVMTLGVYASRSVACAVSAGYAAGRTGRGGDAAPPLVLNTAVMRPCRGGVATPSVVRFQQAAFVMNLMYTFFVLPAGYRGAQSARPLAFSMCAAHTDRRAWRGRGRRSHHQLSDQH